MNPFDGVTWKPAPTEVQTFGKTLVIGMPIVAAVLELVTWWRNGLWATWPLLVSAAGALLGFLCWRMPKFGRPVHVAWHAIGGAIGLVVNHLLLLAVFYLVITPIGLLLRLIGKDPLERKWASSARTYWKEAEKTAGARSYFRQF